MQRLTAHISLGSNLGDRAANIARALQQLANERTAVLRVSRLIENPAVGMPAGSPPFLNGAAELATELSPRQLLERLFTVEHALGRTRGEGWQPRTIDLDLLLYNSQIVCERGLVVPHPHLHRRDFVLKPLAEIAPEVVHPILRKTIDELWQASQRG